MGQGMELFVTYPSRSSKLLETVELGLNVGGGGVLLTRLRGGGDSFMPDLLCGLEQEATDLDNADYGRPPHAARPSPGSRSRLPPSSHSRPDYGGDQTERVDTDGGDRTEVVGSNDDDGPESERGPGGAGSKRPQRPPSDGGGTSTEQPLSKRRSVPAHRMVRMRLSFTVLQDGHVSLTLQIEQRSRLPSTSTTLALAPKKSLTWVPSEGQPETRLAHLPQR